MEIYAHRRSINIHSTFFNIKRLSAFLFVSLHFATAFNMKMPNHLNCCCCLLMFQFKLLARLKLKSAVVFAFFLKRFLKFLFMKCLAAEKKYKTFSFSFGLKSKLLLCMQQKCSECEELWMIMNAFIHVHRAKDTEKPVLMTSFLTVSWLRTTVHRHLLTCWENAALFICKLYVFLQLRAEQRLSSICILKSLFIIAWQNLQTTFETRKSCDDKQTFVLLGLPRKCVILRAHGKDSTSSKNKHTWNEELTSSCHWHCPIVKHFIRHFLIFLGICLFAFWLRGK